MKPRNNNRSGGKPRNGLRSNNTIRRPSKPHPLKNKTTSANPTIPTDKPLFPMRINKYLAWKKQSTRRGADELIQKKQVSINGRLAVLGDRVNETDLIEIKLKGKQKPYLYFAYNKPRGIVTHSAQKGDQEIKHVVPIKDIFPIGRLDKDSHGLIILTNDGRITKGLLNPEEDHEKEYLVTTKNILRGSFKEKMEAGVQIEDEKTLPCKVKILDEKEFSVVLTEGKKHQIRRMCVALFQDVDDLKRTRIMNINLGDLKEGAYRQIEGNELRTFLRALGMEA